MAGKLKLNPNSRRAYIIGRFSVISLVLILVAVTIVIFLLNTTVIHADDWNRKGDQTLADTMLIKPLRGEILACDGSILATNLNYYNIRIDFQATRFRTDWYAAALDSLADTLAVHYPVRTRKEWRERLARPLDDSVQNRSRSYMLLKHVPFDDIERVKKFPFFKRSRNSNRTGLTTERVLLRRYPYGDMAQLSIGRVGEIPGQARVVRGVSGLECALDTMLYGTPGVAKKVLFTRGEAYWTVRKPVNGITLTTTIDITMQDILEHELGEMLVKCNGEWGTAILMDVATGDIKAISNLDLDTVSGHGYIEAMNHAVERYEPGSVIKVLSMLVALEDGFAYPLERTYPIEAKSVGYRYAGGKPIRDSHSPGSLPVSRFIEYSSNIGMTKLMAPHFEGDLNSFRRRLGELGFFDRFRTGMAREKIPYYPTLDPKSGGRVSLARMFYGYSTMVPPLYTCAIYNAIANGGKFVRPRLVKGMKMPDGTDSVIPVSYVRDSICSQANAKVLREMIHSVVWGEGGTAKNLRNKIVDIAGKTGTASIAVERPAGVSKDDFKGGYLEGKHNRVAFCGFFPYENPKYTCIVVINHPRGPFGPSYTCGEVLKNVALKLYSRGLLGNSSDYHEESTPGTHPTLYASHNAKRVSTLHDDLHFVGADVIAAPPLRTDASAVPDVRGLGIREALVTLEEAGFNVHFSGTGYVASQQPPAGTRIAPGARVDVTLRQD